MYTDLTYKQREIGRLILRLYEDAARSEGYTRTIRMATLAGEPLYRVCGYQGIETVTDERGGVPVPPLRMGKML